MDTASYPIGPASSGYFLDRGWRKLCPLNCFIPVFPAYFPHQCHPLRADLLSVMDSFCVTTPVFPAQFPQNFPHDLIPEKNAQFPLDADVRDPNNVGRTDGLSLPCSTMHSCWFPPFGRRWRDGCDNLGKGGRAAGDTPASSPIPRNEEIVRKAIILDEIPYPYSSKDRKSAFHDKRPSRQ